MFPGSDVSERDTGFTATVCGGVYPHPSSREASNALLGWRPVGAWRARGEGLVVLGPRAPAELPRGAAEAPADRVADRSLLPEAVRGGDLGGRHVGRGDAPVRPVAPEVVDALLLRRPYD